jgi:diguanylate cyclase (GGDEF)-like protein
MTKKHFGVPCFTVSQRSKAILSTAPTEPKRFPVEKGQLRSCLVLPFRNEHIRPSLELFMLIPLVSVALAVISAAITFQLGVPNNLLEYLRTTVSVALCVSVPMGALAAQYDFRTRKANKKLEELASTDQLTGLLNRRSFLSAVSDEMARMQRTGNTGAIALLDLDHFKSLNDRFGHPFGDEVLCQVAVLLHEELRHPFDKVARWGGEEFVILVSNVTRAQSEMIFERVRNRIAQHLFDAKGYSSKVTASLGVAMVKADSNLEQALDAADQALYEAKTAGRNRLVLQQELNVADAVELAS